MARILMTDGFHTIKESRQELVNAINTTGGWPFVHILCRIDSFEKGEERYEEMCINASHIIRIT